MVIMKYLIIDWIIMILDYNWLDNNDIRWLSDMWYYDFIPMYLFSKYFERC